MILNYLIEIIKVKNHNVHPYEFCYFANTVELNGKKEIPNDQSISASQYNLPALAFYVKQSLKNKREWLNKQSGQPSFFFKLSFPQESYICGRDVSDCGLHEGLSSVDQQEFWIAYKNPNNPNPHA